MLRRETTARLPKEATSKPKFKRCKAGPSLDAKRNKFSANVAIVLHHPRFRLSLRRLIECNISLFARLLPLLCSSVCFKYPHTHASIPSSCVGSFLPKPGAAYRVIIFILHSVWKPVCPASCSAAARTCCAMRRLPCSGGMPPLGTLRSC